MAHTPTVLSLPDWHCRWPLACDNNATCPGCHLAGTDAGCRSCQARTTADRHSDTEER